MSRIGKKPIDVPAGVKVEISGEVVKISGPKGELTQKISPQVISEVKDGKILVSLKEKGSSDGKVRALWGLCRALINNMVLGVTKGFEKKLDIQGIGYKAAIEQNDLVLNVGFTNPVKVKCPEGIKFSVEKNIITVAGQDKEKVGQISAIIRKVKKAEPYKGKGIKYFGEKIRRKEGKKVVAAKT